MIAHGDPGVDRDLVAARGFPQAIEKRLLDERIGTQQVLPLRAAPAEQIGSSRDDFSRNGHELAMSTTRAKGRRVSFRALTAFVPCPGQL